MSLRAELLLSLPALPLVLLASGLGFLTLRDRQPRIDDTLAYADEYLSINPARSMWLATWDSVWGVGIHEELGTDGPAPIVAPAVGALESCGLRDGDVLAAEVVMWSERGPPWQVSWRPENATGDADVDCVRAVLSALPADRREPIEQTAVLVFRLRWAERAGGPWGRLAAPDRSRAPQEAP